MHKTQANLTKQDDLKAFIYNLILISSAKKMSKNGTICHISKFVMTFFFILTNLLICFLRFCNVHNLLSILLEKRDTTSKQNHITCILYFILKYICQCFFNFKYFYSDNFKIGHIYRHNVVITDCNIYVDIIILFYSIHLLFRIRKLKYTNDMIW